MVFVRKVQDEMQLLIDQGIRQDEAVEILLKRLRCLLETDAHKPTEREVSSLNETINNAIWWSFTVVMEPL